MHRLLLILSLSILLTGCQKDTPQSIEELFLQIKEAKANKNIEDLNALVYDADSLNQNKSLIIEGILKDNWDTSFLEYYCSDYALDYILSESINFSPTIVKNGRNRYLHPFRRLSRKKLRQLDSTNTFRLLNSGITVIVCNIKDEGYKLLTWKNLEYPCPKQQPNFNTEVLIHKLENRKDLILKIKSTQIELFNSFKFVSQSDLILNNIYKLSQQILIDNNLPNDFFLDQVTINQKNLEGRQLNSLFKTNKRARMSKETSLILADIEKGVRDLILIYSKINSNIIKQSSIIQFSEFSLNKDRSVIMPGRPRLNILYDSPINSLIVLKEFETELLCLRNTYASLLKEQ